MNPNLANQYRESQRVLYAAIEQICQALGINPRDAEAEDWRPVVEAVKALQDSARPEEPAFDLIRCLNCQNAFSVNPPLRLLDRDAVAVCPVCEREHDRVTLSHQCIGAYPCKRCDGRGSIRNEAFVWVDCPTCDGRGVHRMEY